MSVTKTPSKDENANKPPHDPMVVDDEAAKNRAAQLAGAPTPEELAKDPKAGTEEAQRKNARARQTEAGFGEQPKLGDCVFFSPGGTQGDKKKLKPATVVELPGEEQPDQLRVMLEVHGVTTDRFVGATEGTTEGTYRRTAD